MLYGLDIRVDFLLTFLSMPPQEIYEGEAQKCGHAQTVEPGQSVGNPMGVVHEWWDLLQRSDLHPFAAPREVSVGMVTLSEHAKAVQKCCSATLFNALDSSIYSTYPVEWMSEYDTLKWDDSSRCDGNLDEKPTASGPPGNGMSVSRPHDDGSCENGGNPCHMQAYPEYVVTSGEQPDLALPTLIISSKRKAELGDIDHACKKKLTR